MIYDQPICITCKHYDQNSGTCAAFKKEIPDEIYLGDNKHTTPLPGQKNDLVYTPIAGAKK